MENKKIYSSIRDFSLLDIAVYIDDNEKPIYKGMVEKAPEEIKQLKYSKINLSTKTEIFVYSYLQ